MVEVSTTVETKEFPSQVLEVYALEEEEADHLRRHTLLHLPIPEVSSGEYDVEDEDTYNLLMADVSASMYLSWKALVSAWNSHVAPHLKGRTEIYVFDDRVRLVRKSCFLSKVDYRGGMTDLFWAVSTIAHNVSACREKNIRVFFVTDGEHTVPRGNTEAVLEQMTVPEGKRCEFYLWGIGNAFPVEYSLEIRWRLHNGSTNMPTLFWSKDPKDVEKEAKDIETYLIGAKKLVSLSRSGCLAPGLPEKREFYLGEWIYMECDPDALGWLHVSTSKGMIAKCRLERRQLTMDLLLDAVIPQWNSQLIQMHSLKKPIPVKVIPFMERVFQFLLSQMPTADLATIQGRLLRKKARVARHRFQTLVNSSNTLLTKGRFMDEMALVEAILRTTMTARKHFVRGLELKGHKEEDYAESCRVFMHTYIQVKEELKALDVTQEDCCRITLSSTIGDLKDEGFPELMKLNKFEFLKTFSMSGLPVFSHSRDSAELNPWSFKIDRILTSPFDVLSQVALEEYASVDAKVVGLKDKEVRFQQDRDESCCNAVIPVFSAAVARVVKPLVRTKLYAMCATFALLKNPHIIDYTTHMAGLAATWIKTLSDFPVVSGRPKFVRERLESIASTAMIYLDRPSFVEYMRVLLANPPHALMTVCPQSDPEGKQIKCEALVKPLFLLYMSPKIGHRVDHQVKASIVRLAAIEFLGRCLTHTAVCDFPFTTYFMQGLAEEEKKKKWLHERFKGFSGNIMASEGNLLGRFYFPEVIKKHVFRLLKEKQGALNEALHAAVEPRVTGLERLSSVHNCGDVTWSSLQMCAIELGLSEEEVKEIFSDHNALVYMCQALTYTSSAERLHTPTSDYDACLKKVKSEVLKELTGSAREFVHEELCQAYLKQWYEEYDACHGAEVLVRPMTRTQIVGEARTKGIDVTGETFDQVYPRYSEKLGLLRNACQSSGCPFYLEPRRSFAQHVAAGRLPGRFLHRLQQVASGEGDIHTKVELLKSFNCDTVATNPDLFEVYQRNMDTLSFLYQQYSLASRCANL